jgi:hypothetical protein
MATIYRHSILGNMETIRRRGYECLCLCDESVYIRLLHLEKHFYRIVWLHFNPPRFIWVGRDLGGKLTGVKLNKPLV